MTIRAATADDAAVIEAIYRPIVEHTAISFELDPPDRDEIARRIVETTTSFPWLVLERGGDVVGYAYAGRYQPRAAYQWTAEVSIYIAEAARRTGAGHELLRALLADLGARGFRNAIARTTLPNPGSVRLFETEGFTLNGIARGVGFKLDVWHDVGEWQKVLA